jgi:hypothetical protein
MPAPAATHGETTMADLMRLERRDHPMSWAEFWERIPVERRCNCGREDCGVLMRSCSSCGSELTAKVLVERPVVQFVCDGCGALLDELRLEGGGQ